MTVDGRDSITALCKVKKARRARVGFRRNRQAASIIDAERVALRLLEIQRRGFQARIFNLMFDIPTFQRLSASLFIGARAR